MDTAALIDSLDKQYTNRTLLRNMKIMLWHAGGLSYVEIGRKYHISKQRVAVIVETWTELFKSIETIQGN